MVREIYEEIVKGNEIRQNLSKLRQELKQPVNVHALFYAMGMQEDVFPPLLSHEDPKVRKNTALVMALIGKAEYVSYLYEAYEAEETLFVRSAYLTALREFDYREYLSPLKERLAKLSNVEITPENKKHITEEMRVLSDLIVTMEGVKSHKFIGFHEPSEFILLTNRNHIDVTKQALGQIPCKTFGAGLMVKTDQIETVLQVRTYEELLFLVPGMKTCEKDIESAAKKIVQSELISFLETRHKGKAPFYFRIELKAKMELDKKSAFTKRLANEIERYSNRMLINTTSNYEIEIRLIENKEGSFNVLVKLFTLKDTRFTYRKEVLPTSIRPTNAALVVELVKEYLKEEGKVLDPFCGVGTMLIERHKAVKANTMYGIDIYGEAIEKARENTQAARQIIHYINKDFFEFKHEYLFDEIITDMPRVLGRKTENEIYTLYDLFFRKAKEHLFDDGVILLYSHNIDFVKKLAPKYQYQIEKIVEINRREGAYVAILRKSHRN